MAKRRELLRLPPGLLAHSRFKARKSRDPGDVEKLAERIKRIGYEETRAVWAVPAGEGYEVFAGGTRLEAAKRAGLHEIPVLVHYGYTDEEISFLSDLDNENDEYHKPVPITDVWAEYARLHKEEGWTVEQIARAKGVSKTTVSYRIRLNDIPQKVKSFVHSGLLTEAHLKVLVDVFHSSEHTADYSKSWLTPDEAIVELAEKAVHDRKKNGEKSVRALEADVAEWKAWIAVAKEIHEALEDEVTLYDFATDPPYGMAYESGRRWATKAPEKILNDDEGAFDLLEAVLKKAVPKLKEDAHVLVFCSWRGEPRVREVLENIGLKVKSSIVWIKEEHSAGDLKGSFAPRHERIVHAVKGNPELSPRKPDVFLVPRAGRALHPMEKPVDLLKELIECTTEKGDLVFDPFAGVASTAVAALELDRDFIAFELDPEYYEKGRERLLRVAQEKVESDVHLLTQPA